MAPKSKKKKPASKPKIKREPDVVDGMIQLVNQVHESGFPADRKIDVEVIVHTPVPNDNSAIALPKGVTVEDLSLALHEKNEYATLRIAINMTKEQVIEMYKIVTNTHPEFKVQAAERITAPLQIR